MSGAVFAAAVVIALWFVQQPAPELAQVLERASGYVLAYETALSGVVAEEEYQQTVPAPRSSSSSTSRLDARGAANPLPVSRRRTTRASVVLVRVPGRGYVPFRDVFEVDGKAVKDRDDRLARLFITATPGSLDQAAALTEESARYNLGEVVRTINVPTLALRFLQAEQAGGVRFRRDGSDTIDGRTVWVLEFDETAHPTLVRTEGGADVPSRGRVWIDPDTGEVLRTRHEARLPALVATFTVTYERREGISVPVPVRMEEVHLNTARGLVLRGLARYSRFQQVQVNTEVIVQKPPGR